MRVDQPIPAQQGSLAAGDLAEPARHRPLAVQGAGLILIAILTGLHGHWAAQVLLVPLLLIVPGVILLRALRVPGEAVASYPVYVPSASLLVMLVSGLAVDMLGPLAGITAPLRSVPLLVGLELTCVALLGLAANAPADTRIPWERLSDQVRSAWPLLLPVLAAAGALRLNGGNDNHIAVVALTLLVIVPVATFLFAPWLDEPLLYSITFGVALAAMWSFSLRGDSVYGFDITSEYHSLHQTVVAGIWHFSHPNDAYGAMLSLTVLPTELHALSGLEDLLVFKLIYPMIGAFFPVAVYSLARRVLASRWAYLATALIVMQQTFFQQFTALARQEVATVLFAALITAALDTKIEQRARWIFVFLLSLGMVVSHYSTAYLAIPLLGIAVFVQWAASWFRSIPRLTGAVLLACVASIASATVWYGSLTHSTSNISEFITAAKTQGINLLPGSGGNPLSGYLKGEGFEAMTPAQYQKYVSNYYAKNDKFVTPLASASRPEYALKPAPDSTPPVRWELGSNLIDLADLLIQQFMNLFAGVGALVLAWRRRPLSPAARQVGFLGLGAMAILALTRVSGTIALYYNPTRAFLQSMIVLGIAICWLFQRAGARWKPIRPAILVICASSFAVFLASSSGLTGAALGGGTLTNLANNYSDYQQFDITAPEVAAAAWVNNAARADQLIYADRYGQLRMNIVAGSRSGVLGDIIPQTIDQHAWVYADRTNLIDGIARTSSNNYSASYAFPIRFLDSNFNVVYANGTSEVFHR